MDSSFALIGAHQHGKAVGFMNGENPRVSKTLYCRGECKALLKAPAPHNTCGSCWLRTARHLLPRLTRGRRIRSYPDLCASCRIRETEDWGEFNISWQLYMYKVLYGEIIIFCAAFLREYSYICSHYVLPFTSFNSMLCCLLEISKCLWLWWWRRSEVRFEGLPEFIWSDLGEQDVVRQGSFGAVFMLSIVVVKNLKLDLSLGQFNVEQGNNIYCC